MAGQPRRHPQRRLSAAIAMGAAPAADTVPRAAREPREPTPLSDGERAVLDALRGMAYGQVEVVVHSSRIVQITRSQKLRLGDDAG